MFIPILKSRPAAGSYCQCCVSAFSWWWSTTSSSTLHCRPCLLSWVPQPVACNGLLIRTHWSLHVCFSPSVPWVTSSGAKASFNSAWWHLWLAQCGHRLHNPLRHSSLRAVQWALALQRSSLRRSPSSSISSVIRWNVRRQLVCGRQYREWLLRSGQSREDYSWNHGGLAGIHRH